jgi:hypothetical protein
VEAGAAEEFIESNKDERVVEGDREVYMAKMARAFETIEVTCSASAGGKGGKGRVENKLARRRRT